MSKRFERQAYRTALIVYKQARRVVVVVIGGTILLLGLVMLVTPGPGVAGLVIGLAVLAIEFAWARRLLKRVRSGAVDLGSAVRDSLRLGRRRETAPTEHEADRGGEPPQTCPQDGDGGEPGGERQRLGP